MGSLNDYRETIRTNVLRRAPSFERRAAAGLYVRRAMQQIQEFQNQSVYRPQGVHEGIFSRSPAGRDLRQPRQHGGKDGAGARDAAVASGAYESGLGPRMLAAESRMKQSTLSPLTIVDTHPVQYRAPVYAAVERTHGIPVRSIYGSDYSIAGGFDKEFQASVTWDNFAVDPQTTTFLSSIRPGTSGRTVALGDALAMTRPGAVLVTGYQPFFHIRAFLEAKRRRYPVLFRAETTDRTARRSRVKGRVRDWLLRLLYRGCDRILPIGSHSFEHYRRLGCPERKLVMSPYCVDTQVFQHEERHRRGTPRAYAAGTRNLRRPHRAAVFG